MYDKYDHDRRKGSYNLQDTWVTKLPDRGKDKHKGLKICWTSCWKHKKDFWQEANQDKQYRKQRISLCVCVFGERRQVEEEKGNITKASSINEDNWKTNTFFSHWRAVEPDCLEFVDYKPEKTPAISAECTASSSWWWTL